MTTNVVMASYTNLYGGFNTRRYTSVHESCASGLNLTSIAFVSEQANKHLELVAICRPSRALTSPTLWLVVVIAHMQ